MQYTTNIILKHCFKLTYQKYSLLNSFLIFYFVELSVTGINYGLNKYYIDLNTRLLNN